MANITNWREKIEVGDVSEASRRSGVSVSAYHRSKDKTADQWTKSQRKINIALKAVINEREKEIELLTDND